ncbi:MAG: GntR family transcriptional regulator [Fusobacteriales bacterium]|nr:MAG: GntR family transcriptional regulator [Fusobacteriales bacterium]
MKMLNLNTKLKTPLYLQIYSEIKNFILEGSLVSKSKLPSKRNLMKKYNISQNTIQNALYLLMEEGYIYSEERKGYFVSDLENLYVKANISHKKKKENKISKVKYNFSYSGVDSASLPRNIFKKLSKEIYEEMNNDFSFQGEIQGYKLLRESICEYLSEARGFEAEAKQIIISSGTEYLFHIIFKLFKNVKYGLENPGYKMLQDLFFSNKIDYSAINLDDEGMIVDELKEKNINIACITPSHQFPTGVIMPIKRRQEILNWANSKENRYIVEDDYDSEFKYNGKPIPALKAIDYKDKVVYIGSFSKSISPAIRVSYMVLPRKLLEIYKKKLPYFICPVSIPTQKILYKFIQEGHFVKHLNRMRTIYKKKRELLVNCLKEESRKKFKKEIKIQGADAGLHIIVSFPFNIVEKEFLKVCKENSIKIYPLRDYYLEKKSENLFFLLGYASLTNQDIEEGVKLIMELVKKSKFEKRISSIEV